VRVTATPASLLLTNAGAEPVFTFVVGRETAALIDWIPCVDAARCPPIAPGATRREPRPTRPGGAPEGEALVYWWRAAPGPGDAPRPDRIRVIVVRLPVARLR
jgi:hypothetical protein